MSHEVLKLLLFVTIPSINCDVIIEDAKNLSVLKTFDDDAARFGANLPSDGLLGRVVPAEPIYACAAIKPPPDIFLPPGQGWIALIKRGSGKDASLKDDCTFQNKVERAMAANYSAVIVFNNEGNAIISMGGDRDDLIPSVFVGKRSGEKIKSTYNYTSTQFVVKLTDDTPFDINNYLLPFAIVVGICFIIMLAIMIFKCVQDRRREYRHRLPKSSLKKIPTKKFVAGDELHYETCCICLDDYVVGDKLRILPCEHAYHVKCIDPWLLKNKRVCPQCRKKVFATGEAPPSDSDSETEDERAPLLARPRIAAAHTAFTPHVENPFQRAARRMANRAVSESGSSTNSSSVSSSPETDGQLPARILGNQLTAEVHNEPPGSGGNGTHLVQIDPVEEEMVQIEPLDGGIEPLDGGIEPLDDAIVPANSTQDEMVHFEPIQEETPPLQYIQKTESSPVQSDTAVEMSRDAEASGQPYPPEDSMVDPVGDQSDPQVYIQQPGVDSGPPVQAGVEQSPSSQAGVEGSPPSQVGVVTNFGSVEAISTEEPDDDHSGAQIV